MNPNHYPGKGCQCAASDANDCCCPDVDWTPTEVVRLREENAALKERIRQLEEGEYDEALD